MAFFKLLTVAAAVLGASFASSAEAAAAKSKPRAVYATNFCNDGPGRCLRYTDGFCRGYIYYDVWGDKRCVRDRNGKRGFRFHRSWGSEPVFHEWRN